MWCSLENSMETFVVRNCETRGYKWCGNSLAQSFDPRSIQTSLKETVRAGCKAGEWNQNRHCRWLECVCRSSTGRWWWSTCRSLKLWTQKWLSYSNCQMVHPAWREVLCEVDIGSVQGDAVQMKLEWSIHKEQPGAAKGSLQSTDWQTSAISSINASNRWYEECGLCSRTYDWSEFWNGHHGFARILREVRIIPGGDGVIQRICKFLCEHFFFYFRVLSCPCVIGWHA